jgi:hypothetical protein
MTFAHFRFYEELNDFIAPARRKREFALRCARTATVKNAIESVGVPHTEVELILANGESVDFGYRVREGDRISVYPMFEAFDVDLVQGYKFARAAFMLRQWRYQKGIVTKR